MGPHEKILEVVLHAVLLALDSSINDGAPLSESVAIQTTVSSDRRTTVKISKQSLDARRHRAGTPGRPNQETPLSSAANLEAATV